jgi:hypothetical protein
MKFLKYKIRSTYETDKELEILEVNLLIFSEVHDKLLNKVWEKVWINIFYFIIDQIGE